MFIKSSMDLSRESERRERELGNQKTELEYQKLYNNGMEAMLFELSRFRHNYSNTLAALQGFADSGDYERLKEYIDELCQKQHIAFAENRTALAQIKNGAVAGLLASKMLKAEKSEVVFKLSVNGELNSVKMPLMELCEILGILLDNAVEAAAETAEKYVRTDIEAAETGTVFRIENSVDKKPDIPRLFEKGYTTKANGSGIGLNIAETLLRKNSSSSLNTFADDNRLIQELSVIS
jgi:two-component system sensor histidine kinase AgrC